METAAVPAPASPPPLPRTDLFWGGRPLDESSAATTFFLGSLAIILLGVGLNYALTDGMWITDAQPVQSALGEGPTYLTATPYDFVTLSILVAALILLGAGFVAPYQIKFSHPAILTLGGLTLLATSAWAVSRYTSYTVAEPTFLGTLGAILGLGLAAVLLGARLGVGQTMHRVRAAGFVLFGLYWATQAMRLYTAEAGDFVNGAFACFAVLFFNYFAYQELLSERLGEDPRALHWLAGAAFLTTGVYVATHKLQVVSEWLILHVAAQTTWLLQFFGQGVVRCGGDPEGSQIQYPYDNMDCYGYFPIMIILACTAIQSIMIFVGGIAALRPPIRGDGLSGRIGNYERLRPTYPTRRFFALLLTVPLIYALNLFRNVIIISMSGSGRPWYFSDHPGATDFICNFTSDASCQAEEAAFWFSHNIIGKGGSLVALIIIAFMVFQILPELYDSIVGLLDLKDRRGPLERFMRWGERPRKRGPAATAPAPTPTYAPAPDPPEA